MYVHRLTRSLRFCVLGTTPVADITKSQPYSLLLLSFTYNGQDSVQRGREGPREGGIVNKKIQLLGHLDQRDEMLKLQN